MKTSAGRLALSKLHFTNLACSGLVRAKILDLAYTNYLALITGSRLITISYDMTDCCWLTFCKTSNLSYMYLLVWHRLMQKVQSAYHFP